MKTITFRVGKKEGPTAQHRGLYQIFGDRTLWKIGYYAVQQKLIQHYKSTIIFFEKVFDMENDGESRRIIE